MTRTLWSVLLLATGATYAGVAYAGEAPKPERPPGPAEPPAAARPAAAPPAATAPAAPATTTVEAKPEAKANDDPKSKEAPDLGMSILGNQEAPKALVIVPWKTSEMGDAHGISTMLDDSRLPIDREVFMRLLSYYEIRSNTAPTAPGRKR